MFNWQKHYTGISVAEVGPLYMQRDTRTGTLQFARLSAAVRVGPRGAWAYYMLGVHLGTTNHLNHRAGCEVFTSKGHAGFTYAPQPCALHYSGSACEPFTRVTLTLGRLFVGMNSPRWLVKCKQWQQARYWAKQEAAFAAYEAQFGEEN